MIVPRLTIATGDLNDHAAEANCVEQIKHWGFLGLVAVRLDGNLEDHDAAMFRRVIKKASGFCDMIVEAQNFTEKTALDFLNDGVSKLFRNTETGHAWPAVPPDRVIDRSLDSLAAKVDDQSENWTDLETESSLSPESPQEIADLIVQKHHFLIDVQSLEKHPNLIVDVLSKILKTDRDDGLIPTVICDPLGIALGLAYSNRDSLRHAIASREGTYWSRSRNELWIKGKTSGATQKLLAIRFDCDHDCLRFTVTQGPPGFCHKNTHTCFGEERTIATVIQRLAERIESSNEKSFTRKLATDAAFLEKKLLEEAKELSEASQEDDRHEIAWEAADVLYFSLVAMLKNGVGLDEVYAELARRMNRVVRRD